MMVPEEGTDLTTTRLTCEPHLLWEITFNYSSPRVQTLMRGLSPAYLRIGGTTADQKVFSQQPSEVFQSTSDPTLLVLNSE